MAETNMLRTAVYGLDQYYQSRAYSESFDSKELADIVVYHAAAAGVSAMATWVYPGYGTSAAMGAMMGVIGVSGITMGAIGAMYIRIAAYLKLKVGKDTLKTIATTVYSNITLRLAGVLTMGMAISSIPGIGVFKFGLMSFGVTYSAGVICLNTLTRIFASGIHPDEMTDSQLEEQFDSASKNMDAKTVFNEAKNKFKQMNADGSLETSGMKADIKM